MDNAHVSTYDPPTFEVEELEVSELAADFNPADAVVVIGAVITVGVLISGMVSKC
jgi:hypothetical protein